MLGRVIEKVAGTFPSPPPPPPPPLGVERLSELLELDSLPATSSAVTLYEYVVPATTLESWWLVVVTVVRSVPLRYIL